MTEGNRLYLVCTAHAEPAHALMLGKRLQTAYGRAPGAHEMNTWFDEHSQCPGAPDCFRIAYQNPQNHDVDPPADPATDVKAAVKLALVK